MARGPRASRVNERVSVMIWAVAAIGTAPVTMFYTLNALRMWVQSRFYLRSTGREGREKMLRLRQVSAEGDRLAFTRLMLLYIGAAVLVVALLARMFLGVIVAVMPFALVWWLQVRTTTPPVALLLGSSNVIGVQRQREAKRRLSPLRVVSMLNVHIPWDKALTLDVQLDCFRTSNDEDWLIAVHDLMKLTPFLCLDARAPTPPVLLEARRILDGDLWKRCLFITAGDGSLPVVEAILPKGEIIKRNLRVAYGEDAAAVLESMVVETRQLH